MNTQLLEKIEKAYYKNDFGAFNTGDTVAVHNVIREGEKTRVQIFKGVVIAKKGSGTRATFTVRKISDGIGVEKIFPIQSPNVEKVDVLKRGLVRRSKLYYLRDRVGKAALKVRQGKEVVSVPVEAVTEEPKVEAVKPAEEEATEETAKAK
jgi:large subunit ribosomal protein L19